MNNIFENAYFGKAYKTKDGTIVKFVIQRGGNDFSIYIPKCRYSIETTHRYNSKGEFYLGDGEYGHAALDIDSEYYEKINEEELDKLAEKELPYFPDNSNIEEIYNKIISDLRLTYKAGYRKGVNDGINH